MGYSGLKTRSENSFKKVYIQRIIRIVKRFIAKNFNKTIPKLHDDKLDLVGKDKNFLAKLTEYFVNYKKALENVKIKEGLRIFMELSSLGNSYFQETEPWISFKEDKER